MKIMSFKGCSAKEQSNIEETFNTFHHFSRLPIEIQRMIWADAARPFTHGAHFFTFGFPYEDISSFSLFCAVDKGSAWDYSLAAPKARHASQNLGYDWIDGNSSAYIRDAGLWTACRDSNLAMNNAYQALDSRIDYAGSWYSEAFEDSHFQYNGEEWKFAIFPGRDLICFQPHSEMPLYSFVNVAWPQLPSGLHMGSWNKFSNIAFEYDPMWMDVLEQHIYYGNVSWDKSPFAIYLKSVLYAVDGWEMLEGRVWLIDYQIKRRGIEDTSVVELAELDSANVEMETEEQHNDGDSDNDDGDDDSQEEGSEAEEELHVFYGNGRKYVEVRDLESCDWRACQNGDTAIHFLNLLDEIIHPPDDPPMPPEYSRSVWDLRDWVGVLCEERYH